MNWRKWISAGLAVGLLALAGCGGSPAKPQPGPAPGGTDSQGPVTITYWDFVDPKAEGPRSKALADNLKAFEDANPGIKVKVEVLPWNQIDPQLMQAAGAGKAPDVVRVLDQHLPKHVKAKNVIELDPFLDDAVKQDWLLGWDTLIYNGKKMALPLEYRTNMLFYRTDLMKGKQVPKTWDEMVATSKELASSERAGLIVGLSRADNAVGISDAIFSYLWEAGVDALDKDGKAGFDNPQGYQVFQRIADLVKSGATPQTAVSTGYEDVFQAVKAGASVFQFMGTHRIESARSAANLKGKLFVAPLPGMNTQGKPTPAHVFGWTLAITKNAKNQQAAWKFIKHMTDAKTQIHQVKTAGELPTRKSPYSDAWFKDDPLGKEFAEIATYMQSGKNGRYSEHHVELSQFWADAIQSIVVQGVPVEKAVKDAATKYNALLK